MVKGAYGYCPRCGNTQPGARIFQCKNKSCQGICCEGCAPRTWMNHLKCPFCALVGFAGPFHTMGKIREGAGPVRMDWRPKRPTIAPGFGPGGSAAQGGPGEWEDIDFPEWEAAPPRAAGVAHEKPYSGYTQENARRALERSNVDPNRPQDRDQAVHLARYVSWVLKDRAFDFIEDAARDESLPMSVRAFYIHAAQLVGRT